MVLTAADDGEIDAHSNFIDGGGRSVGCTSVAVSIEAGTPSPTKPAGRFRSNVLRAGECMTRIAVRETTEAYEPKPGRWIVDAEVGLPETAEPGVYAYEIRFESGAVTFERQLTFVVLAR